MAALEEEILESLIKNSWLWWRYMDDIFMIWHHGENELKQFVDKLDKFHFILEKESTLQMYKLFKKITKYQQICA